MTGAYMTWTYGPAGWIADLNEYIKDPAKTNPNYNWDDVLPGLRASTAWNGVPGGELGSADAKQWCMPWGFELNNISYNKKMFDKVGVQPPKNLAELLEVVGQAHQGSRRPLRHRRARLALLGDDPSGLPVGLRQLRREGLQRHRRQAEGRDELRPESKAFHKLLGGDDPGYRARRTGRPTPGTRSAPISAPAPPA